MKYIWRSETTINKYAHKQLATAVIDFEDGVNQVIKYAKGLQFTKQVPISFGGNDQIIKSIWPFMT